MKKESEENETTTNKQITDLISRFNNPDNMNGEIINVIMGSRKISEGFSFKNIQVEDIHTPWYNYSETSQAIARGFRLGSHRALIDAGLTFVFLMVYDPCLLIYIYTVKSCLYYYYT